MSSVVRNRLKFGKISCVRKCKKNEYREFDHSSTLTTDTCKPAHKCKLLLLLQLLLFMLLLLLL